MNAEIKWDSVNHSLQTHEELLHEIDQLLELAEIDSELEGSASLE